MPEEQVQSLWHRHCVEQLQLKRKAALTEALTALHSDTTAEDLRMLKDSSLLGWVAILHRNCYVGRNITEYAWAAKDYEHVRMLCMGQYDIAPLLGIKGPILVSTVHDVDKVSNCLRVPYTGRWIPSCQKTSEGQLFRAWRNTYGVRLLELMPEVGPYISVRCWQALFKQCDPKQLKQIIQTGHGAKEIWRGIVALAGLAIPCDDAPADLQSLFPKN
jgi:hypothetical protein